MEFQKFDDPQKNKVMKLFYESFKNNLINYDDKKIIFLSFELTKYLYSTIKNDIPKIVRSKCFNLRDKNNPSLCKRVYEGIITPEEYINMTDDDMKSLDLKEEEKKLSKIHSETDIFKCSKCGQRKASYRQLQTRSADEPMTTFVTCVCGHNWSFDNIISVETERNII
ncbi:transcription elongation factor s-ii [Vairimorpha apis BRL 01]|uniref:Transcription elongation factor s-ii n=1 Tax=Vairimorpha apis BRL 01 TaxID=1037528 RepID=T0MB81_9MICR|nr:transcription elongation factor s-ii [Vairimorpha apis BRL 01]